MKPFLPDDAMPIGRDDPDPARRHLVDLNPHLRLGMMLFLASLTMLFVASIVCYLVIRLASPATLPSGHIELPGGLWVSTVVLLGSGLTVYAADRSSRRDRIAALRLWLGLSFGLGVTFLAIQTPCMIDLLWAHKMALTQYNSGIYGLTFALVIVHALHVIGGLIPLGLLTRKALRHSLGQELQPAVRACATYWHFLEVVWIVLFGMFLLTA